MKIPKGKQLVIRIVKTVALKLVLVFVLLSASGIVYASNGHFWGYLPNGDTAWLWCGSGGNYWTRCDTGSCAPGESCPCYTCDTGPCQETADFWCAMLND